MQTQTYPKLHAAVATASLNILGQHDVPNKAHADFMTAIIEAYGQADDGFLYAEPVLMSGDFAPDLVLVHPDVGVLVFEVKAYDVDFIRGAEAGSLKIWRNGREEQINPLRQAQRSMYAIRDMFERLAPGEKGRPLFNAMVAMPNITETQWLESGFENSLQRRLVLFYDDCLDPERLRIRISRYITQKLNLSGLPEALPPGSENTLFLIFGHSILLDKPRRDVQAIDVDNLGAEIAAMENAHKSLSVQQQQLARLDTWGHPFLLRGVAGSGKSVVLAYHVARAVFRHERLHQQLTLFPDDRHQLPQIAVVCINRTLAPLLRQLIEEAYFDVASKALPENVVTVAHLNGLIYDLAAAHDHFHYVPMKRGQDTSERTRQYQMQLDSMTPAELDLLRFDALYIDDGQDVPPEVLTLLHSLVRPDATSGERTLSIYYDDAQNIYGNPRPTWREFGLNVEGGRAAFMTECYRNSQEIVEFGLNVLLGTAADERMRVETRRFADIYTLKEKNLVHESADGWRVHFAEQSGVQPSVQVFPSRVAQTDWVAAAVYDLLDAEGVRPEDILILAGKAGSFEFIERAIGSLGVDIRMVGGRNRTTIDDPLLVPGALTLATIHSSKGYDAPIVFLIDADQLPTDVTGRALFYVGATRAKRYLIVTGVKTAGSLLDEAAAVRRSLFS